MNEADFRSLYTEYRDRLFRFGYRLTGSAEAAEDLVHDCFVSLYREGFDPEKGSIRTYLYSALRNLARKHYRDSGREDLSDDPDASVAASALEAMISQEIGVAVQRAVGALPLPQREALVLFEYEELPLEEIARIVGAEAGAVKSRLHRAREALRKSLEPLMKGMAR